MGDEDSKSGFAIIVILLLVIGFAILMTVALFRLLG